MHIAEVVTIAKSLPLLRLNTYKSLILSYSADYRRILVKNSNILLLGITFKENCPDIRNTKIVDIYSTLQEYTSNIVVYDPWANIDRVKHVYGIKLETQNIDTLKGKFDVVILGVAHNEFKNINIRDFLSTSNGVVYDVKGILDKTIIDGRL